MGRSVTFLKGQGKGRLLIQFSNYFFFTFSKWQLRFAQTLKDSMKRGENLSFYDVIAKVTC
jgi:hypothetical protein